MIVMVSVVVGVVGASVVIVGAVAIVLRCGVLCCVVLCFVVAVSCLLVGAEIHSNRCPNQPKIDPTSTKSGPGGTPK